MRITPNEFLAMVAITGSEKQAVYALLSDHTNHPDVRYRQLCNEVTFELMASPVRRPTYLEEVEIWCRVLNKHASVAKRNRAITRRRPMRRQRNQQHDQHDQDER